MRAACGRWPGRAAGAPRAPAPSDDRRRRLPARAAGRSDRPAGRRAPRNRSAGRAARTGRTAVSRFGILPCGMAMPLPTAVEPSFSRCIRMSKIARSFWPVSTAARAASSCSACFLLLTLSAGMIAFGATRSVSGIDGTWESVSDARGRSLARRRTIGRVHSAVNGLPALPARGGSIQPKCPSARR